jgi:hypothetical protein
MTAVVSAMQRCPVAPKEALTFHGCQNAYTFQELKPTLE